MAYDFDRSKMHILQYSIMTKHIETTRLIIRNFTPDDADDLYEILGDSETMKNCESAYDFRKTKEFLHSFCIGKNGAAAAVHKQSKKVIGYILLSETRPSVYEMGWFINRSYWRQGYAYEACKAVIDYAFYELDAHKVFAETIDSVKSVGLMRKLGMKSEGVQRSQTKDNNGNWADLYFYGLLKEEWVKILCQN
ncbi:MAG: GNAT family N-acetyltransferase [Clostridiales bacterium]|nr:GNAT family N-acetyltransferase [Clostridiales bacterium]